MFKIVSPLLNQPAKSCRVRLDMEGKTIEAFLRLNWEEITSGLTPPVPMENYIAPLSAPDLSFHWWRLGSYQQTPVDIVRRKDGIELNFLSESAARSYLQERGIVGDIPAIEWNRSNENEY